MIAFRGKLIALASGGQYVILSDASAVAAGVGQHDRIRGTVEGVAYQSSVGRYSDEFHVGVPTAVVQEIGAAIGDIVELTIEPDPDPPGETIPALGLAEVKPKPRLRKAKPTPKSKKKKR